MVSPLVSILLRTVREYLLPNKSYHFRKTPHRRSPKAYWHQPALWIPTDCLLLWDVGMANNSRNKIRAASWTDSSVMQLYMRGDRCRCCASVLWLGIQTRMCPLHHFKVYSSMVGYTLWCLHTLTSLTWLPKTEYVRGFHWTQSSGLGGWCGKNSLTWINCGLITRYRFWMLISYYILIYGVGRYCTVPVLNSLSKCSSYRGTYSRYSR